MTEVSGSKGPTMVPYFGYWDAANALEWLAAAFGFERMREFSAPDGTVMHAEMSFGAGTIMLGTGQPPAGGGSDITKTFPTGHGTYVVVEDVDAHHERAKAAGARVVTDPKIRSLGRGGIASWTPGDTSGASVLTDLRPDNGYPQTFRRRENSWRAR